MQKVSLFLEIFQSGMLGNVSRERKCIYINQVIAKVNDVVRNRQNSQHMVCHAVAGRVKLNCPSNVSRTVGFQLPQDLPPV